MALAKIKTEEERMRLDIIFAEIEADRVIDEAKKAANDSAVHEEVVTASERRLEQQTAACIAGNARIMLKDGAFKTKWERVLAKTLIRLMDENEFIERKELSAKNAELNLLRNFANAVEQRLEKAERSAREQDNHHYYKIFAEGVKELLEAL